MKSRGPQLRHDDLDVRLGASDTHPTDDVMEAYESDALSPETEELVDQHLESCSACTERFDHFIAMCEAWKGPSGERRLASLRDKLQSTLGGGVSSLRDPQLVMDFAATPDAPHTVVAFPNLRELRRAAREHEMYSLLVAASAIERDFDYALPNGLHTDTHINLAKVCESETWLRRVVDTLGSALNDIDFNAIVSTGWVMGTIARRVIDDHRSRNRRRVRHLVVEGYAEPVLLDDAAAGSLAVVLVDVVVTGRLVSQIIDELQRQAVTVVKVVAMVDAGLTTSTSIPVLDTLCRIPMNLVDRHHCSRCGVLPLVEFNPVAYRMTRKKTEPRSPSRFLDDDDLAREFWGLVDRSAAYEHHRVIGRRHYVGFIDTIRLLHHPNTGRFVSERLCRLIADREGVPDVILVPPRKRGLLLGRSLVAGFRDRFGADVRLVAARRVRGEIYVGSRLDGKIVLVAGAAAAHGDTLDRLAVFATRHNARSVTATVLLSRLSEACEEAFDARLSGGFVRLYSLPVRPVTSRDKVPRQCPVCSRHREIKEAAANLPPGRARDLARLVAHAPRGFPRPAVSANIPRQDSLFPLVGCRRGVASGVALHALHAAIGDGMAPLTMPEINNPTIPRTNRAAMIEDLPVAALTWSGHHLRDDLVEYLKTGTDADVWLAAAEYMSRAGSPEWLGCLRDAIPQLTMGTDSPEAQFWGTLTCTLYRTIRRSPELTAVIRAELQRLLHFYDGTNTSVELESVLAAIRK